MKILIISNLYPPSVRGGAEMIARDTAQEAVRQGHEVSVLSTSPSGGELERDELEGVGVYRFEPRLPYYLLDDAEQKLRARIIWHIKDLCGTRSTRLLVREVIKETSPDLIVSFNLRGMEIGSVAREIKRSRTIWYHELHDVQLLIPSGLKWFGPEARKGLRWLWQNPVLARIYQRCVAHIMSSPHEIVGPSQYIVDAHKDASMFKKSSSRMIINPVKMSEETVARTRDRDSKKATRLLYVGQLEPHKGVHDLIEALNYVDEHKIRLDIVGDGSWKEELMSIAVETPENIDIKFRGRVSHERVFELMAKADALVLPSVVVENCPGVILEARTVGLPVIASDVGGVSELIDPDGLFQPGDPLGIAQKIHDVVGGKIKSLGKEGLLDVEEYVEVLVR